MVISGYVQSPCNMDTFCPGRLGLVTWSGRITKQSSTHSGPCCWLRPLSFLLVMLVTSLLLLIPLVSAGPAMGPADSSIPLTRRRPAAGNRAEWLRDQGHLLKTKYGTQTNPRSKRANTGTLSLTNQDSDITYYGTVSIGTPGIFI